MLNPERRTDVTKFMIRILQILALGSLGTALLSAAGPRSAIKVVETEPLVPQADLRQIGMANSDSTSPIITDAQGRQWIYLSEGGKFDGRHSHVYRLRTDGRSVDLDSAEPVAFVGIPDAGVNDYNGWKAWLMTLYSLGGEEWWAMIHLEDQDYDSREAFRLGSAYSKDGGRTFQFLGFIVSPHLSEEIVKQGNCAGKINVAGGGMRWDDDYLYLYFSDMSREDRKDRRIAVARAPREEIAAKARSGRPAQWHKYFEGKWNEPGLGGRSSSLGRLGEYHTSLIYSDFLQQWIMFSERGENLVMLRSSDPLDFHVPEETVMSFPGKHGAAYFTLLPSEDAEAPGQAFELFYRLEHQKVYDVMRTHVAFD